MISCNSFSQELSSNFFKAYAYFSKKNFDSAIFYFDKCITENQPKVSFYLGKAYYFKKNFNKAIDFFKNAIDNKNYEAYLWIARSYSGLNNKSLTLENLRLYLLNEKYKLPSYKIKRDTAFRNLNKSKEWYDFWQLNWYSNEELICEEVEQLLNKNMISYAQNILDTLSYNKNKEEIILYYKAITNLYNNNLPSALSFINHTLSKNKSRKEYLELKVNILFSLGYYKESIDLINQILKIEPENFELYLKRSFAYKTIGQHDLSLKDLQFYYNFFPENINVAFELAQSYNKNLKYIESLKILNNLLKNDPSKYEYYLERGKAYYHSNMLQQAENDFSMVLDLNPQIGEAFYYLGLINIKKNNKKNACELFNKAINKGFTKAVEMLIDFCQ